MLKKFRGTEGMRLKTEVLALAFGALLIFVTFGDAHLARNVGNLDVIFGSTLWQSLDAAYPIASIAVFLLYGKAKGGFRINMLTVAMLLTYLIALALISIDDIAMVLNFSITLTKTYWVAIEWFYPIYSSIAFFIFGEANVLKRRSKPA